MEKIKNERLPASKADPQHTYMAVKVLERCHTEIHGTIGELKRGSSVRAKQQIALIISWLANALSVL